MPTWRTRGTASSFVELFCVAISIVCAALELSGPPPRRLESAPAEPAAIVALQSAPARLWPVSCPARRRLVARQPRPAAARRSLAPAASATSPARLNGPEARHAVGIVEVPLVLDQADEVADRRIGRPGAAKRRTREIRRHAGLQKGADVGCPRRSIRSAAGWRDRTGPRAAGAIGCAVGRRRNSRAASFASTGAVFVRRASRLRRDHAIEKFLRLAHQLLVVARRAPRQRFRIGAVALALDERLLDMVLGDEIGNRLPGSPPASAPVSTRSLPASVMASPSAGSAVTVSKRIGRLAFASAATPPTAAASSIIEIVAVIGRFRAIQLDRGGAGIERRPLAVVGQLGPGRRLRHAGQHADRPPEKSIHWLAPCCARPRRRPECVCSGAATLN